jgi:hypothetical protein
MMFVTALVLCFCICSSYAHGGDAGDHAQHGYRYGSNVNIECRSPNGTWSQHAGIQCVNFASGASSLAGSFKFGYLHCWTLGCAVVVAF